MQVGKAAVVRMLLALVLACTLTCGVAVAEEGNAAPPPPVEAPEAKPAAETAPAALALKREAVAAAEAAPLGDYVSNQNIGNAIDEIRQIRKGYIDLGIGRRIETLEEQIYRYTRIRFAAAYTVLYQRASDGDGPLDGSGGDLDWIAAWDAWGEPGKNAGILSAAFEGRHRIGSLIAPAGLSATIDSLWTTVSGFNRQDFSLIQLYWEQEFSRGRWTVKVGKLSPYSWFFGNRVNSSSTMLINYAFSDNPAVFMPGNGFGIHARYRPSERWTFVGGVQDANGVKTDLSFEYFHEGEFWFAGQAEYTVDIQGLGIGTYRVGGWYVDARQEPDRQPGGGTVLSFDQELGKRWIAFLRYEYQGSSLLTLDVALQSLTATRNSLRLGALLQGPIKRWPDDLLAFGLAWGDPAEGPADDTFVAEILYRGQMTENSQLSFGLQMIQSSTVFEQVFVFSTRWRITF